MSLYLLRLIEQVRTLPSAVYDKMEKEIRKIHKETCISELKEASRLNGKETKRELDIILEKCQCIQIASLLNGFITK